MSKRECDNCRFVVDARLNQECHRLPPVITPATGGAWPDVNPTDWCGEWAPDELNPAAQESK